LQCPLQHMNSWNRCWTLTQGWNFKTVWTPYDARGYVRGLLGCHIIAVMWVVTSISLQFWNEDWGDTYLQNGSNNIQDHMVS
jgi:hypothetical protein